MNELDKARYRELDGETLERFMDTDMLVRLPPQDDDYRDSAGVYDVGCLSSRGDPEQGNIGMRLVPGNASGEDRYTTNRPAANMSPAAVAEQVGDADLSTGVYVPLEWVLAALEADSAEELLEDDL